MRRTSERFTELIVQRQHELEERERLLESELNEVRREREAIGVFLSDPNVSALMATHTASGSSVAKPDARTGGPDADPKAACPEQRAHSPGGGPPRAGRAKGARTGTDRGPTLAEAAERVLAAHGKPLHARDLLERMRDECGVAPKAHDPVVSLTSVLIRSRRFTRSAPNTWTLAGASDGEPPGPTRGGPEHGRAGQAVATGKGEAGHGGVTPMERGG
jgi:hypothetical protein